MNTVANLILLPGMMCDERSFEPQVTHFSGRINVSVPQLNDSDSMAGLASAVLADAPPTFALGGLSMGGMVAMEVIAQAPERITHLALLDTIPTAETEEAGVYRRQQIERTKAGELAHFMEHEQIPMYLKPGDDQKPYADMCLQMAIDLGDQVFINQAQALIDRPDYTDSLKKVTCPALCLTGAEDKLCTPEAVKQMADLIPGCEFEVIEDVAHLTTVESPDRVNAALDRLLER